MPFSPSSIRAKDFRLFGREKLVNTVLGEGKRVDVFLCALMYFCGGTRRSPPEFLAELCSDEGMPARLHSGNMKLFSLTKCH